MDVTSLKAASTNPTAGMQASSVAQASLGKDDFLKLFVTQLQHQDPMNPMTDQDFMGQMASFSTLEQVSNLAASNATLASGAALDQAVGLIGRRVTYTDTAGETRTGVVERVSTQDGQPALRVDGVDGVEPSSITEVA
jgi:flagellar basal-body rod modification protein FlgD